jgi:hypothetical chaperone protein
MQTTYLGIDFGTSNCTAGRLDPQGRPELLLLSEESTYLSSALYLPWPDDYDAEDDLQKKPSLAQLLRQPSRALLGQPAHDRYSMDPLGGVFIRSPKSMLGSRLNPLQTQLYQQVCSLMLSHIHQQADQSGQQQAEFAVIGRPVHFQGIDGSDGDARAETLLRAAAASAGFREVQFAYEPVAAAVEYERTLSTEQLVLVVDIGGGTSDISLIRLGPSRAHQADRSHDLLSHAGRRLGGVDMDIKLALYGLMPLLGRGSLAQSGKPLPSALFSDAVNIIDIYAQEQFYQAATAKEIAQLLEIAAVPSQVALLQTLYRQHLSYYLVQQAEQAKISLASTTEVQVKLDRLQAGLQTQLDHAMLDHALYVEMNGLRSLISECLADAGVMPDQIFLTGGASAAPGVKRQLQQLLPEVPIIAGDRFGSVGKGLCTLAALHFA